MQRPRTPRDSCLSPSAGESAYRLLSARPKLTCTADPSPAMRSSAPSQVDAGPTNGASCATSPQKKGVLITRPAKLAEGGQTHVSRHAVRQPMRRTQHTPAMVLAPGAPHASPQTCMLRRRRRQTSGHRAGLTFPGPLGARSLCTCTHMRANTEREGEREREGYAHKHRHRRAQSRHARRHTHAHQHMRAHTRAPPEDSVLHFRQPLVLTSLRWRSGRSYWQWPSSAGYRP